MRSALREAEHPDQARGQGKGRQAASEAGDEDLAAGRRDPLADDSHSSAFARRRPEIQDGDAV